jgi:hypothetical protein
MNLQIIDDADALYDSLLNNKGEHLESLLGAKNKEYKILKHTLKPIKNKKIISFSVYGEKSIFLNGAEVNIDEAQEIYPDWICRFYCTKDIKNLNTLLNDDRCEVLVLDSNIWPMYWRFFSIDDPLTDVFISRDSDSIVGNKEKFAVEDWINRKESLHTMHDYDAQDAHSKIIMGGMWGLQCKNFYGLTNLINLYAKRFGYQWQYSQDQSFLEEILYQLFIGDCVDHTSHKKIKWNHSIPFPNDSKNKYGLFVGDRISPFQTGKSEAYSHNKESNKIYLFCHQSERDFKACNALIRHISEQNEEVIVVSKHPKFVSKMIEDVSNIKVLPISDDQQGMEFYMDVYKKEYKFVGVGLLAENSSSFNVSNPEESFYQQFDLNKKELEEKYNLC